MSLANRYGSPRTPERPYALTAAELIPWAGRAFLYANLAVLCLFLLTGVGTAVVQGRFDGLGFGILLTLLIIPMFVVPVSFVALFGAGLPLARLIEAALQTSRRAAAHLIAFAGLGAVIGFLAPIAADWAVVRRSRPDGPFGNPGLLLFAAVMAAVGAASCAAAWRRTLRRALARDAELARAGTSAPVPDEN